MKERDTGREKDGDTGRERAREKDRDKIEVILHYFCCLSHSETKGPCSFTHIALIFAFSIAFLKSQALEINSWPLLSNKFLMGASNLAVRERERKRVIEKERKRERQ